ncbi:hypothetical protein LX16_1177 [Stackebrandtia albiflava]|uniref:Uncharacterized protein n=1 Tax=Stackebrandtia albiflava TaxID=406432 RepID=A0A562VCB6_9ACTN|nr:hypothetical protein [Stackebrandtia albiflava]TWJ15467.1 hypothetical protein LX16_1177 [Stackebrandtia albiflava]
MLRALEIRAELSGLEDSHRDRLFWEPTIELSVDCFVCERVRRTTVLKPGADRALCSGGEDGGHPAPARVSAFDVTTGADRLALRAVVDLWWASFRDTGRGEDGSPLSGWVRLHYGCHCHHAGVTVKGSVQTNTRRPHPVTCGGCRTGIGTDAAAPTIRLLV